LRDKRQQGFVIMTHSVRIHEFGDPDVLRIETISLPKPGPDEVRLCIHAIGLNRTEITLRSGRFPAKPPLPTCIGFEAAGVIEDIGDGVEDFAIGDRVALLPAYSAAQYALYAEAANVPANVLVPIPARRSFEEAAATWAAFGTAWAGLVAVGGLQAGEIVLVPAASSSVGLAAIQIANRLGAHPIALTRGAAKADALRSQGASAVVVTGQEDTVAAVKTVTNGRGAPLVFDPVGGPHFAQLAKAAANGGRLVLYGALDTQPTVIPPFDIFARDLTVRGVALTAVARDETRREALVHFVTEGMAEGALRPVIARRFAFEEIAAAHRFMEAGEQIGKIIVTV